MTAEANESKTQIAHVLCIRLVASAQCPADQQALAMGRLNALVWSSTRFRVADAAGKLICHTTDDQMTLAFLGESEAAMECGLESATALKADQDLQVEMGLHSGPVTTVSEPNEPSRIFGEGVDVAGQMAALGDAGHILLSKRIAYDLAPSPRWNAHFFELGECEVDGHKASIVNFHTGDVGNPKTPAKIERARKEAEARTRRRRLLRRLKIVGIATTVLVTIAIATIVIRRQLGEKAAAAVAEKSLAVLPFVDLNRTPDQEYFCDGISEEIRDLLAKVDGLRVVGRASSFSFKDKNTTPGAIGQRLNVAMILQGTLQREGNRIRANVQLLNTRTGYRILTGTFEREMPDVFVLEHEIRRAVVSAIKIKSGVSAAAPAQENVEAYNLYLQALFFSNKNDEVDLRKSVELFQRALNEDPKLSRAWTGIARTWFRLGQAYVKPLDAFTRVQAAAEKALAANEKDAEAHYYLGETKRILNWDLKGEEAELKRALQIDSNLADVHVSLGQLRASLGEEEKYLGQTRTALRLDPLDPSIVNAQVVAAVDTNHLGEALTEAKRMIDIDPSYTYFEPALALVYREQGKLREALDIYARLEQTRQQPTSGLAITYARLENPEQAKRVLDQLTQRANAYYFPGEQIAAVYAALGDNDSAIHWLDRAIEDHSPSIYRIGFAREFQKLRTDPRFPELLRRISLDPAKSANKK